MAALRRLVLAAFVVGLSALPSLPSLDFLPRTDWTDPDRAWARGPVWYVMTHAEYSGYRRLRTQDDRAGFIREFWSLRDPIPDTPENELEAEFWERVRIADDRFGQDIKPGWKTERGKVFIMLGPPDNTEGDQILADRWGASSWIYDLGRMPYQLRMAVEESLRVASERAVIRIKVREETEGMRSLGGAMPVQSSVLRPTEFLPLAETLIRRVPGPDSLRNLGHVMRVPEVLDRLYSRVHVSTVFTMIPVEARVDFRPIEDRGRTTVAVTLGVRWPDLEAAGVTTFDPSGVVLTGRLTDFHDDRRVHDLTGRFALDPDAGSADPSRLVFTFQALADLRAGRYILDVSFQDTNDRIMGSVRDRIEVPSFGDDGLQVSSMILSSRLDRLYNEPGDGAANAAADPAFRLGPYRVIPRTTQVYSQPADLKVFYEVYGAGLGAGGAARLALTYQFYLLDGDAWLPVGPPISVEESAETSQAWGVPLRGWPPGRYRLEVFVSDRVGGATALRGAFFEIESPAATTTTATHR